jgi:TRAP transporter TAXI family solute receptor
MFIASLVLLAAAAFAAGPGRMAFEIATGPVSGDLYIQGERLAGVVSHPPGLSRCADPAMCGPEGLIATARATAGVADGLLAIARGEIASAFAPADVAAAMRLSAGKGKQNQSRLRTIGLVGEETLFVVAASKGPVTSLRGLRNRWVGVGARGSRTRVAANALLAAARLGPNDVRRAEVDGAEAANLIEAKRLDAFIWIGAKLPAPLKTLIANGHARIVPLDKGTVLRLTAARLGYSAAKKDEVDTVAVPVVWLADEKQHADIVFSVARAAFEARNAALLNPSQSDPSSLKLSQPPADFVLPLHAGAARLFAANGRASN